MAVLHNNKEEDILGSFTHSFMIGRVTFDWTKGMPKITVEPDLHKTTELSAE